VHDDHRLSEHNGLEKRTALSWLRLTAWLCDDYCDDPGLAAGASGHVLPTLVFRRGLDMKLNADIRHRSLISVGPSDGIYVGPLVNG
jgi:hypothetical protein